MSLNRAMLIGHLGRDPELRYTAQSKAVCNLSIATTDKWTDKGGAKQERTEWHRVVLWGAQAEAAGKYLAKGREIFVEGRLETKSYDKDGHKHFATEIVADRFSFVGSKQGGRSEQEHPANDAAESSAPLDPDNIPF